jgi:O-antigen ligase
MAVATGERRTASSPGRQHARSRWALIFDDAQAAPSWLAPILVAIVLGTVGAWAVAGADIASATLASGAAIAALLVATAGWRMWPLLVIAVAVRSSLDWFVASRSTGGETPVTGLQPAIALGAVVLVLGLAWLFVQWAVGTLVRPSPVTFGFGAYVLACLATSIAGNHPLLNLQTSLRAMAGLVLVALIEQMLLRRPERIRPLLAAFGLSLIVPACVSVHEIFTRTADKNWTQATFVNRNTYAVYLTVVAIVLIAIRRHVHGWARFGAMVGASLATGLLVFTYTRAAWAGLAVGFLVLAALGERWLLWVVAIGGIVVWAFVPSVSDRLADLDNDRVANLGDPNSWEFRTRYWRELIATYIDGEPIDQVIAGVGLGTVERENPEGLEPHNVWVQSLVETGIIGTLALGGFLVVATRTSLRVIRRLRRREEDRLARAVAMATCAVIGNWVVQSISQNLVTEAVMWTYIAVPLGIVAAASHEIEWRARSDPRDAVRDADTLSPESRTH